MPIDLADYDKQTKKAIKTFWGNRQRAKQRQESSGIADRGERAGVTSGKNMEGFVNLVRSIVERNGLSSDDIHLQRAVLTLPGFFRPTKLWDMLVIRNDRLIAAIEL